MEQSGRITRVFSVFLPSVSLFHRVASSSSSWSRSDTVRYVLDIMAMLVVVPKVQLVLADAVEVLDETRSAVSTVGQ